MDMKLERKMESRIKRMYFQDCAVIVIFMAILWLLLIFAVTKVSVIAPTRTVSMIIIIVGLAAGAFATASSIAVLSHLKKNQRQLYVEEILSYENN